MVTVHTGAETIQGRKLFKGGNYIYGKYNDGLLIAMIFKETQKKIKYLIKLDFHIVKSLKTCKKIFLEHCKLWQYGLCSFQEGKQN